MDDVLIRLEELRFAYGSGDFVLDLPRLELLRGQHVACIGASGTGKTTLLHLIGGILVPRPGRIEVLGTEVSALRERARRRFRLSKIGMVFQRFELLEYLSALENVLLPYRMGVREGVADARPRARELARVTGIEPLLDRKPGRLSQGEQQRVALCRALVTRPPLLLCDEPTGNLDPKSAGAALDLLFEQANEHESTLIVVTHDHSLLSRFDRVLDMRELTQEVSA